MVTDNDIRNRICPAAAKAVATAIYAGDSIEIRTKTKEYTGKCIAHFKTVRDKPVADRPADENEILTLPKLPRSKEELQDLITKAAGVLKQVITGTGGPGTPPPGDPNAVGQKLNLDMKRLGDDQTAPSYVFGNFTHNVDPMTLPAGVTAPIDYQAKDAAGSEVHKAPAKVTLVAKFLQDAQKTVTAAWVAEAEKGAPAGGKAGSDAWLALQHLRAFAKNVTNLPPEIKAEVDKLRAITGFNAGPAAGRCGDGKVDTGEICDDGDGNNGNPGKCNATCDGTVDDPSETYFVRNLEFNAGFIGGFSAGRCLNFSEGVDADAPASTRALQGVISGDNRCFIPGTTAEGKHAGGMYGGIFDIKYRLLPWGNKREKSVGGLWLGVTALVLSDQDFASIDLKDDNLSSTTRAAIGKGSTANFGVSHWAVGGLVGVSAANDQFRVYLNLLGGESTYEGLSGLLFTGSTPSLEADSITLTTTAFIPALRLAYACNWGSKKAGGGIEIGVLIGGIIHTDKERNTIRDKTNRPILFSDDAFVGMAYIQADLSLVSGE